MICDRIKLLREKSGMTQSELSRKLGITRSGVNAWEMGLSIPSTQYVVELALLFNVSTDYLLGLNSTATVSVAGLQDREIAAIVELINCLKGNTK
ncbi:MAG: helix-turn-helix transcriptional regulator [Clostridia bacterium]|nr:helix-turn-helix transcriptional regulator [Clostridia bacterium]